MVYHYSLETFNVKGIIKMQDYSHTSAKNGLAKKSWRVWWKLTRPHTLTAGFTPVLVGTALAHEHIPSLNIGLFVAMMAAALLIQIATNLFNEYYDFKKGLDNEESIGIGGGIVHEGLSPKSILTLALVLYGISALIGIYICANSSWWLVLIGLLSMSMGYFYTGGPYPIAYTPFGEITSGFFMGCLIILISYFIQTGNVTVDAWLVTVPFFLTVGAILLSNNIRDRVGDKKGGRKTLAILIGKKNAIIVLASMFAFSYIWAFVLVFSGITSPWTLLVLLSIPKAIQAVKGFMANDTPPEMMPAMKATGQTNTFYGLLFALGMYIGFFF